MADEVDSWYSWVVVAVCFVVYFMNYGVVRLSGLFFSDVISYYNVDRERASTPFLMGSVARSISGPVCGYLSHTFGFRFAILLGCFLSSLGIFACSFAQDINALCASWTVYGFGYGISTVILPQVINLFNIKHASKANGIALCGSAIAGIILPFITVALLNTYGMPGTFLNLSALMLSTIPGAILLRNPNFKTLKDSKHEKDSCKIDICADDKSMLEEKEVASESLEMSLNCKSSSLRDCKDHALSKYNQLQDTSVKKQTSFEELSIATHDESRVKTQIDGKNLVKLNYSPLNIRVASKMQTFDEIKDVLKTSKVLHSGKKLNESLPSCDNLKKNKNSVNNENYSVTNEGSFNKTHKTLPKKSNKFFSEPSHNTSSINKKQNCLNLFSIFWDPLFIVFSILRCFCVLLYIVVPTILVDFSTDKGIEVYLSTYLLMAYSLADLFGKLCLGWITDGNHMSKIRYVAVWYCILAFSLGLMAWSNGFIAMTIAVILKSTGVGTILPTVFVLLSQYFEKDNQSMAIASTEIFLLPWCFGTAPLIGYFRDHLGSYDGLAYILSAVSIFCSILVLLIPSISNWRLKRKRNTLKLNR